jgi:hypothetical protein
MTGGPAVILHSSGPRGARCPNQLPAGWLGIVQASNRSEALTTTNAIDPLPYLPLLQQKD